MTERENQFSFYWINRMCILYNISCGVCPVFNHMKNSYYNALCTSKATDLSGANRDALCFHRAIYYY